MVSGVLFDVDGTLVDSNYLHVVAWSQAFGAYGHDVPMANIHALIGQGSERLVESVLGEVDDRVVDAHADFYGPSLYRLSAFADAGALLRRAKASGLQVVLATSAAESDVVHLRRAIDADDAIDHVTTKDDADSSKPAPDILQVALEAVGLAASDCVFVGDSVWDVEAAAKIDTPTVGVLTGGIDEHQLNDAGAVEVYKDVAAILASFDTSRLSLK